MLSEDTTCRVIKVNIKDVSKYTLLDLISNVDGKLGIYLEKNNNFNIILVKFGFNINYNTIFNGKEFKNAIWILETDLIESNEDEEDDDSQFEDDFDE